MPWNGREACPKTAPYRAPPHTFRTDQSRGSVRICTWQKSLVSDSSVHTASLSHSAAANLHKACSRPGSTPATRRGSQHEGAADLIPTMGFFSPQPSQKTPSWTGLPSAAHLRSHASKSYRAHMLWYRGLSNFRAPTLAGTFASRWPHSSWVIELHLLHPHQNEECP